MIYTDVHTYKKGKYEESDLRGKIVNPFSPSGTSEKAGCVLSWVEILEWAGPTDKHPPLNSYTCWMPLVSVVNSIKDIES